MWLFLRQDSKKQRIPEGIGLRGGGVEGATAMVIWERSSREGLCVSAMKRLVAFSNFPCYLQSVLCSNIFL